MKERAYQTAGVGRVVLLRASVDLAEHVRFAMASKVRCWIRSRHREPDDRFWSVEFRPDGVVIYCAGPYMVSPIMAGNQPWLTAAHHIVCDILAQRKEST